MPVVARSVTQGTHGEIQTVVAHFLAGRENPQIKRKLPAFIRASPAQEVSEREQIRRDSPALIPDVRRLWYLGMSVFIVATPYPNTMIPTTEAGISS